MHDTIWSYESRRIHLLHDLLYFITMFTLNYLMNSHCIENFGYCKKFGNIMSVTAGHFAIIEFLGNYLFTVAKV